MRLDDLCRAAGLAPPADAPEIRALTADSREVIPGALFAALPGARADGRSFLAEAVGRGAAAVLAPEGTGWPEALPRVALLRAADARRALALMAAAFHREQPETVVAVTGTNGKTSTVDFLRQIWGAAGHRAASLGTLGLVAEGFPAGASLTTPDPVSLHATLGALARGSVTHAAMEASSHGLGQRRLDGVRLAAAGFTNLTRDHLDHHGTMEAYRAAKLRLFEMLLPAGALAVVNAAMEKASLVALADIAARRGLRLMRVGEGGEEVRLLAAEPVAEGQVVTLSAFGARSEVTLPLPGRFQAENALLAFALAVGAGLPADRALAALSRLSGVRGRMELALRLPAGAVAYVDYAHTPDALARLVAALRPHVAPGARLHLLFGAGGDRDPGKRRLMGEAARAADVVWVTDDNPRSESPALIRAAVMAGLDGMAPREVAGRREAIAEALAALRPGDVLAVAGKGHESGQEIAGVVHPFDDAAVLRELAGGAS